MRNGTLAGREATLNESLQNVSCADDEAIRRELAALPTVDEWRGLDAMERDRRALVLADIAQRVREDGPHQAVPADDRGRQFLPFDALKGYDEMVAQTEDAVDNEQNG
jgi:hypothetical protein